MEPRSHHLLLLPSPPSDVSVSTLRVAYGPALSEALTTSASNADSCLDIAVKTRDAYDESPRSVAYDYHQQLSATLYRLIAILMAKKGLDLDGSGGTDVRIVFTHNTKAKPETNPSSATADQLMLKGPVAPLGTLALSTRPWTKVYAVESEAGEEMLRQFSAERKSSSQNNSLRPFEVQRVAGGPSISVSAPERPQKAAQRHSSVAVGGTFDHLHLGHRLLLSMTAYLVDPPDTSGTRGRSITVGISGDELLKNKKYAETLESWEQRQAAVFRFLAGIISFDAEHRANVQLINEEGPNGKAVHYTFDNELTIKCVELSDAFGPTITDESITALVVSGETRAGGQAVNTKRAEKQWAPLEVFEVGVLDAGEADGSESAGAGAFESKISSTEIRRRLASEKAASG